MFLTFLLQLPVAAHPFSLVPAGLSVHDMETSQPNGCRVSSALRPAQTVPPPVVTVVSSIVSGGSLVRASHPFAIFWTRA